MLRLAPFGIGNPEPIFLTRGLTLATPVRPIKEKHICLQLTQTTPGEKAASQAISALGWSRNGSEIAEKPGTSGWAARCTRLGLAQGSVVDILYRLKQNSGPYANPGFGGLELELCDLRLTAG